jgi:hypothetical protein
MSLQRTTRTRTLETCTEKEINLRGVTRGVTRSNFVKDENGDLLADSHNILNGWKQYLCQLLNVHKVSDVTQIGTHTAQSLARDRSYFGF